jgi:hypothetical protein
VPTPQPPPDDSRPGNGYGDDNHDHTGPPGQSDNANCQPAADTSSHGHDGGDDSRWSSSSHGNDAGDSGNGRAQGRGH